MKLLFALCLCFFSVYGATLPSFIKACKKTDNKCIAKNAEDALHKLANGHKDMGINSLEPLHVKSMHVPGHGGNVDIDQTYNNIKLHGLSQTQISSFSVDLDKCLLQGEAFTPSLSVVADFILKGQLLVFPINGNGLSNNTFSDLKSSLTLKCEKFQKDGKEYIKIVDFNVLFAPKTVNFYYDNIVGDETISNEVRKVLNENSDSIFAEIKGDYEASYGLVFKEIANKIFAQIPVNEIFLD